MSRLSPHNSRKDENRKGGMPIDGKTPIGYLFWNIVDRVVVDFHFNRIEVIGPEHLPREGSFILVSNHSSRWDGPVVQHILNRRANYMVSPNEMRGLQGSAVMSVGAFPANPRLDLIGYAHQKLAKGEPVVIFPEGNVFYDGTLHPFKKGVARIALAAARDGLNVPVVPIHIRYSGEEGPCVRVVIGENVSLDEYRDRADSREAMTELAHRLYGEVKALSTISAVKTATISLVDAECPDELKASA